MTTLARSLIVAAIVALPTWPVHAIDYRCRTSPPGTSLPYCASEAFVTESLGARVRASSQPSSPTPTSSPSMVMMGMAGSITPAIGGNVLFHMRFDVSNNASTASCIWQIRYGTGSAPANGDPLTGTASGGVGDLTNNANTVGAIFPASADGYTTGLTAGTTYWYDLALQRNLGGTCSIFNPTLIAIEQ